MSRRGNWQRGFGQRFGQYDTKLKQAITNRHVIWLHAVSVGEMNLCAHLIRALAPRLPNVKLVVSTTTTTGMGQLQKLLPASVSKIYYPVDRRKYVSRAIGSIHPDAIILMESEIWPNFIWRARAGRIPVFLVNARLSDRSYPRYLRFGFLFRDLFRTFEAVSAQNEEDARKLRAAGCRPEAVTVVGNLKFDSATAVRHRALDTGALLEQLGVPAHAPVIVAGSTHDGEETLLAAQFLRLQARFPGLFLVIVPRHFERSRDIARDLRKRGLKPLYRTVVGADTRLAPGEVNCLLVNTTGELMSFYERATIAFVGKSLTAVGGQNPIEPAALGKATVLGPNMQNFADVTRILVSAGAVVQVTGATELEQTLAELLANPARREELGRTAARVVQENQGAVERTVEMILRHLDKGELYIAPKA